MSYPVTPDEVLAVQERLTAWIPSPERVSSAGESVALLMRETVPAELPAEFGAKVTLNEVLWFGFNVIGRFRSSKLNPVPLRLLLDMVTAVVPVLVASTESEEVSPNTVFPKFKLVGVSVKYVVIPVPESEIMTC